MLWPTPPVASGFTILRKLKQNITEQATSFKKVTLSVGSLSDLFDFDWRGVQLFGVSGPHWKKSCLGPHIQYTNTNES